MCYRDKLRTTHGRVTSLTSFRLCAACLRMATFSFLMVDNACIRETFFLSAGSITTALRNEKVQATIVHQDSKHFGGKEQGNTYEYRSQRRMMHLDEHFIYSMIGCRGKPHMRKRGCPKNGRGRGPCVCAKIFLNTQKYLCLDALDTPYPKLYTNKPADENRMEATC